MQLLKILEELGQEIGKIGRVLGPRWAACGLRFALAEWNAYPALYKYFSGEAKYSGKSARLCNKHLLKNLALIIDILQEIFLLSNAFQARGLTLTKAEQLIKRTNQEIEMETKVTCKREIDVRAA